MKSTKLLALILSVCLIFATTSCDIPELDLLFKPEQPSTPENIKPPSQDPQAPPAEDPQAPPAQDPGTNPSPDTGDGALPSSVNVIMINDNHGILNEEDGSIDKIASGISYYASIGNVVKIANGDMFQGTYVSSTLKGLPMLDALNALDFDAFVIGNHEFDWGLEEMKKYKDGDASNGEADFPFLGANIYDKSTEARVDWIDPYTIVEIDGIKIGIIGIIGDVETSILSANVENYDFADAREIVKGLAAELRTSKGCDAVIVAAHGDDDALNATLASYNGLNKIDAIFTGHSHTPTDKEIARADGSSVCVLQNGGYGESFAILTMDFDESKQLIDTDGKLNYTNDFSSAGILSDVFEKYEEYFRTGETVLITIEEEISRYDLGIEIVHYMYLKYGTAYAVINTGGVRTSISAGDVTYADVFQVLPFENEVYIVTLTGAQLKSYLNSGPAIYYWGIYQSNIVDTEEYEMAIVDFVYLGYTFDEYRNDSYIDTNDLIRDVLIELIESAA